MGVFWSCEVATKYYACACNKSITNMPKRHSQQSSSSTAGSPPKRRSQDVNSSGRDTTNSTTTNQPNFDSSCPYQILGVPRNATIQQIKLSYRKLALKHHPDRQSSEADKAYKQRWKFRPS